ncbi:DUF805 domain-containing protein [Sporolactobacillus terrae]|uniref:DUF805 domain-containing protein n=1 Tax=Sporolactobacillus terrae TaxID=269673 RepID=A0ABX5Q9J8_9BACL|nr:DUF805 domain-containing protein [Sporolactobacillus terrae]QAA23343.1 DUF805 domain-containing protein [Sporolactobacillus terrae]QAA26315.1 DUF805 domain-containing protein [Sporolactobacillus terrae]UAK15408.1 DUF805 domain-containing protein [Sporolactobacillus terrae]
MHWYVDVIKNYVGFSGRATRTEFWMFVLVNFFIAIFVELIDKFILNGLRVFSTLYNLAVLIPALAVGARRLHDIGKTGWWQLIGIIPVLGWIVLIVYFCTDTQDKENSYGANPKESLQE